MKNNNESGFEDWFPPNFEDRDHYCNDIDHNPPMNLLVPLGKRYKHICPTCKKIQYLYPTIISYEKPYCKT